VVGKNAYRYVMLKMEYLTTVEELTKERFADSPIR
jgi:hypothetical protein